MKELLVALMVWVGANSGYEINNTPPDVAYKSYQQLHNIMFADKLAFDPNNIIVQALYLDETETIYLPVGFTPDTPEKVATLVHELTHHMQNLSAKKYKCQAAKEPEAYDMQDKFLNTMGLHLEDVGINWLFVAAISTCVRGNYNVAPSGP